MSDAVEAGYLFGKAIKPLILLALGSWFGYRYVKKRQKKAKNDNRIEKGGNLTNESNKK